MVWKQKAAHVTVTQEPQLSVRDMRGHVAHFCDQWPQGDEARRHALRGAGQSRGRHGALGALLEKGGARRALRLYLGRPAEEGKGRDQGE